jgi:hypothetical protein
MLFHFDGFLGAFIGTQTAADAGFLIYHVQLFYFTRNGFYRAVLGTNSAADATGSYDVGFFAITG